MNAKEFKVTIPEGMEIDRENSTFECIKFKPIEHKRWRDDENVGVNGYYIYPDSSIKKYHDGYNCDSNYNVFATEKQAKSALAMARISQIMANDERFGGAITDEEWSDDSNKYSIMRMSNSIMRDSYIRMHHFLAFHTAEQRDLFLEENEDLVKDYLMID